MQFLTRRLVFVLSLIFLGDYPVYQCLLFFTFSVIAFAWTLLFRPFKLELMNTMSIFNEFIVLLIAMTLPVFIDVSIGKEAYDLTGWILVLLLGAVMIINIAVIFPIKIWVVFKTAWEVVTKPCKKRVTEEGFKDIEGTDTKAYALDKVERTDVLEDDRSSFVSSATIFSR